jgi:hypothetical protein
MSAYMEFASIQFANATLLSKALEAMGYTVEVGDLGLYGYEGKERPERAHIVVRRQQIGRAANDLGFRWDDKRQVFIPIISEYDARTNLNQAWRDKLQATYAKAAVVQFLQDKGANVQFSQAGEDGRVVIRATVEV